MSLKYVTLDIKSREFLATAEFLYRNYIDTNIDFSPIILEYSKVIENELNIIFDGSSWLSSYRKTKKNTYTLGTFSLAIKKHKFAVQEMISFGNLLSVFVDCRNGSAHNSLADKTKLNEVRDMFF